MDVVDNNDFLDVFHVFDCWKQYLDIYMDAVVVYNNVVDNNDFLDFMYLVVENNIYILHRCCG